MPDTNAPDLYIDKSKFSKVTSLESAVIIDENGKKHDCIILTEDAYEPIDNDNIDK